VNRMVAAIAALLLCVTPADTEAALAHRAQYQAADHGYLYYASTSHLEGEARANCEAALAFTVAGASRQQVIEHCTPEPVADGLFLLNLKALQWDWRLWHQVLATYPYSPHHKLPLVIRADWLVVQLADATESDAYMLLLYGKAKISKAEYLDAWGVNNKVEAHFGVIAKKEAGSPNNAEIRWVENRPTNDRGSSWGTRDSAKITVDSDPLQHLDGGFKHDAEEWLTAMPKVSSTTGERGFLLAAMLFNAKGEQQNEAPPSIVTDHHGFRGQAAIRNPGGCVSCHATGINPPSVSELRDYITAGVDIYASPKERQEALDRFHFTKPGKQIARDNEDIALAIEAINGLSGQENADAFVGTIELYDRPVSLETAAAELHMEPRELALALAYYNNAGQQIGARLSGLPHGKAMPRATWEQVYHLAYKAKESWGSK
jgi:hypothetical protein